MDDPTSLLYGLDSFRVIDVSHVDDDEVRVVIEVTAVEAACPECGECSRSVKDRPLVRIRDLPPIGGRVVQLWWRTRRLVCAEPVCPRRSFTQTAPQIPPRSRLTARLRDRLATAIVGSNRAVLEVAAEYRVVARRALVADRRRGAMAAGAGADPDSRAG